MDTDCPKTRISVDLTGADQGVFAEAQRLADKRSSAQMCRDALSFYRRMLNESVDRNGLEIVAGGRSKLVYFWVRVLGAHGERGSRLSVDLSAQDLQILNEIREFASIPMSAEIVRTAVRFYLTVLQEKNPDSSLEIVTKAGPRTILLW